MMIVPAGSLVQYSTCWRRRCGGSSFLSDLRLIFRRQDVGRQAGGRLVRRRHPRADAARCRKDVPQARRRHRGLRRDDRRCGQFNRRGRRDRRRERQAGRIGMRGCSAEAGKRVQRCGHRARRAVRLRSAEPFRPDRRHHLVPQQAAPRRLRRFGKNICADAGPESPATPRAKIAATVRRRVIVQYSDFGD